MNRFFLTICFLLMTTLAGFATSHSTSMGVSVTVVNNCTISAGAIEVGTGTMSVACTNAAPAEIELNQGGNIHASSTYTETGSTTSLTAANKGGQNNDAVMVTVTF